LIETNQYLAEAKAILVETNQNLVPSDQDRFRSDQTLVETNQDRVETNQSKSHTNHETSQTNQEKFQTKSIQSQPEQGVSRATQQIRPSFSRHSRAAQDRLRDHHVRAEQHRGNDRQDPVSVPLAHARRRLGGDRGLAGGRIPLLWLARKYIPS